MILYFIYVLIGLFLLVYSSNFFVDGAAAVSRRFGISELLIGMLVIGFGTSAPEMCVSAIAAYSGNDGIVLGNAYGSNIANIALILGLCAIITPLSVNSVIVKRELPILIFVTVVSGLLLLDFQISRIDAIILLALFGFLTYRSILFFKKEAKEDTITPEAAEALEQTGKDKTSLALVKLIGGFVVLLASSRLLVYGATQLAVAFGVSDLIIGLTIVAVGTSLPELASSLVSALKKQSDLAVGNVVGSNLFNTLAVVGLGGIISPVNAEKIVLYRDFSVMLALTLLLYIIVRLYKNDALVNRLSGLLLLGIFIAYTAYLIITSH